MRLKDKIWEDLNQVYKQDLLVEGGGIEGEIDLEDEPPSDEEDLWY